MRSTYRVLAYLVAFGVVLQATFMAWAIFGFGKWIEGGGVMNKAVLEESESWHFTEERGFMFHGINGQMVIPLLVLILLVISFFAKIPGGVVWAAALVVLVAVQVFVLPELGRDMPAFGAVHGFNALVIFAVAVMAGKRVATATAEETSTPVAA